MRILLEDRLNAISCRLQVDLALCAFIDVHLAVWIDRER